MNLCHGEAWKITCLGVSYYFLTHQFLISFPTIAGSLLHLYILLTTSNGGLCWVSLVKHGSFPNPNTKPDKNVSDF